MTDPTPEAEAAHREPDVERLRQQNHDNAAMRDRENADLRSRVTKYENSMAEARERVKDWESVVGPNGWWYHSSQNHRHEVAALIEAVREAAHRDRLDVERLARAIVAWTGATPLHPTFNVTASPNEMAREIERHYARLAAPSAPSSGDLDAPDLEKALYLSALVELYDVLDGPTLALKLSAKTQQALAHAWHVAHPDWSPE